MIIDGKAIAAQVKASLQGSDAKLAVIMVGDEMCIRDSLLAYSAGRVPLRPAYSC